MCHSRNLYSKNLIEAQDEIQEMKRKFKIINHQIEQLKEEISAKDLALVKEHFDHMKASSITPAATAHGLKWHGALFARLRPANVEDLDFCRETEARGCLIDCQT